MLKLKDKEMQAIMAEVEAEIGALVKAESDKLAKAKADDDSGADEGAEAPPAESAAPADSAPAAAAPSAPADASPSPAPSAPADASASAAPMDPSAAPAADPAADAGPVDPEALKAEYAALPPEELKMHFLACKAALMAVMGGAPADEGAQPAPAAAAPSPSPAPPMSPPPPAMKAEPSMEKSALPVQKDEKAGMEMKPPASGGTVPEQHKAAVPGDIKAAKSEKTEGENLAKVEAGKVQELEKQVELLAKAVELAMGQPQRKAVTSVAFLSKGEDAKTTEPMSKAEVSAKLHDVIKSPKLKKSDRERIVSYTMGHVGFEQIKDLLEVK